MSNFTQFPKSNTLVIIDGNVPAYSTLIAGLDSHTKYILLDTNQDGIEQITKALENSPAINTLHIVSHGRPGCIEIGNNTLDSANIESYADQLGKWSAFLGREGEILLYGCEVARGQIGEKFVARLQKLTGLNIAASNTLMGDTQQGGNWNLEFILGRVKSLLAFSPQVRANYGYVLAEFVNDTFTGNSVTGNWIYRENQPGKTVGLTVPGGSGTIPSLSGLSDAAGSGALRLTPGNLSNVGYAGFVLYNTPLSSTSGVKVTFDFFAYGGNGADGISFFLVDGNANPTTPGAAGDGLGYRGLVGGYVGIGFDEYGGYSSSWSPDSIGIKGSTVGGNQNLKRGVVVPGGIDNTSATDRNQALRRAQIVLTPSTAGQPNQLSVAMDLNKDGDFVDAGELLIAPFDLAAVNGPVPANFKFGFAASSGGQTNTHEIRGLVYETVNLPTGANKTVTTDEDVAYTLKVADFGFSDPDQGDSLQLVKIEQLPTTGHLQLNGNNISAANTQISVGDITTGKLKFVPIANASGTPYANFQFRVSDGTSFSTGANQFTINVTSVNDPPIANNDSTSTELNTPVILNIRANDSDVDGSIGSFDLDPTTGGIQSRFSNNQGLFIVKTNGDLLYRPNNNYSGIASLQYQAIDNNVATSNIATVSINVVNQAPVATGETVNTFAGVPVTINVLTNDSDPDGNITAVDIDPTLTGIQNIYKTNYETLSVDSNGIVTYTPSSNWVHSGFRTQYQVIDNLGATSNRAFFQVILGNRDPIANDDFTKTPSNTPINLNIGANDSDPDGSITAFDLNPQVAGIQSDVTTAQGEYHVAYNANTQGAVIFQPNNNFKGTANLAYQVYDTAGATDTANISIVVGNQAPVANNDSDLTPSNTPIFLFPRAYDNDGTVTGFDLDPNTTGIQTNRTTSQGTFSLDINSGVLFTPAKNFKDDIASLDYQAIDNEGLTSNIAIIDVFVENQGPIVTDDIQTVNFDNPSITINIGTNDSDPDGDSITGFDIDLNTPGVQNIYDDGYNDYEVNNRGELIITPYNNPFLLPTGPNQYVQIAFLPSYTAFDNLGKESSTASVNVFSPNRPPVANNDFTTTVTNTPVILDILANDSDPDAPPLGELDEILIPAYGISVPFGSGNYVPVQTSEGYYEFDDTGLVLFNPNAGFRGTANLVYQLYDLPGLSDQATISIVVGNEPPIAGNDSYFTPSNTPQDLWPDTVSYDNDGTVTGFDIDPNTSGVQTNRTTSQGSFSLDNNTGTVTFTPASNFKGLASLDYQAIDNEGLTSNIGIIDIDVENQPPIANDDYTAGPLYTPLTINLGTNDFDPDGSITGFDLDIGTPGVQNTVTHTDGTWSVSNSGQAIFTPDLNQTTTNGGNFVYAAIDNNGGTGEARLDWFFSTNEPVAFDDKHKMLSVQPNLTLNIGKNDFDPDGTIVAFDLNPATAAIETTTITNNGTYSVNNTGQLIFTPASGFKGTANLPYRVWDNSGLSSNIANINITRTVPPIAIDDKTTILSNTRVSLNISANDSDVNGVGITGFDLDPSTAVVDANIITNDGIFLVNNRGLVTFDPNQNFQGTATIPYKIIDKVGETATANISIVVDDQSPIATNDRGGGISNQKLTVNIGINDSDPDGSIVGFDLDPTSTTIETAITKTEGIYSVDNKGVLVFTPASNFQGTANLPYQAIDNSGETSNIATLSITVGNQAPIANNDSTTTTSNQAVTLNIGINDSDVDGSITGFDLDTKTTGIQNNITTGQGSYSVNNQGELVFTPGSNFQGTANLGYQAIDNSGATANANIRITVGNQLPIANNDTTNTLSNKAVTLNIGRNDSDPDGNITAFDLDPTTAKIENSIKTTAGNFQVDNSGKLTFTPAQNFQGVANLPYKVVDNSGATATANISIAVGNQPPVATNDLRNAISNTKVTFNIGINDSDPDGSITAFDLNPQTAGVQNNITTAQGIYNVDRNGQLVFTPANNFQGTANLPYAIVDNSGATATATITTIVSNQLPIANDDSTTTSSNKAVTLNIGLNDTDPDGSITGFDLDPVKTGIQRNITTAQGSYSVNNQGELVFTPDPVFIGIANLGYQAIDNSGELANANISIEVKNSPPVAENDTTNTLSNTAVTLNIGSNDSDPDGSITGFDLDVKKKGIQNNQITADGTYSVDNNGELVFTPVDGFKGTANLQYQALDNQGAADKANINIIVGNQRPVATDDSLSIKSNTVGIINLGANDSDVDGSITAFDLDVKKKGIQTGKVTAEGTYSVDTNGQLTFIPASNFQGTTNLQYQIFDNDGASDKANIKITVEDQPPVATDDLGFAGQNKTGTVNILANDFDPDGSITGIDLDTKKAGIQSVATTAQGQFSVNASGDVTFEPISGFVGTANLPYQIFDNSGATAGAKISMIVGDTPPIAIDDATFTGQNQPVKINVLANDIDYDGSITGVDLDPNTNGVQTQITTTEGKYVVDGRGNVTFTPVAGFTGTASIPYQIFDNNGETAVAVLSIAVGDQPPVATDDIANTRPSKPVSFNILNNDYDPDGSITGVDLNPNQTGIQSQITTGQGKFVVDKSGNLTFTPKAGFLGTASIPYQIFDNNGETAGANIVVTVEDQPPVATDDVAYTNQNTPVTLSNILSNDYDLDGSITGVDLDPKKKGIQSQVIKPEGTFSIDSNGNLAFTPVSGFLGIATLPYQIFDNDGLSATANVIIGVGDQPPIAKDDLALTEKNQAVTFNVLSNDFDFDGNITAVDLNPGQAGVQSQRSTAQGVFSVDANGNVVFTPKQGFVGTASIPYQIFDNNGEKATANINVVVQEPAVINQPPVATDDNGSTTQNEKVTLNILTNDSDADGSITGVDLDTKTTGIQGGITTKQGVFNVDSKGDLTFAPANGFSGVATLPYTIFDNNGATATANISITVSKPTVNQNPIVVDDGTSTTANQPVQLNILANDFDIDGNIVSADLDWKKAGIQTLVTNSQGQFSLDNNGNLTFTPAKDFIGTATLEYQITDNAGGTDIGNITIGIPTSTVTNLPPIAVDDLTFTTVNQPVNLDILGNDFDIDGNIVSADLDWQTAGIQTLVTTAEGTFSLDNNDNLTFTPVSDFIGEATLEYQITDNGGETDIGNISITIPDDTVTTNKPPIAVDDVTYTTINQAVQLNISSNDFDIDGSITEVDLDWKKAGIQKLVTTSQGQFSLANDGNLTFTPAKDFTGEATLEYQITDNGGETDIGNINITIPKSTTPTNISPIAVDDVTFTTVNQPVNLDILGNDFDIDGNIVSADLDWQTAGIQTLVTTAEGTFSLDNNDNLTFTPVSDFIGEATLEYQITDNGGETDIGNISITIPDDTVTTNKPPIAVDDVTHTTINQAVQLNISSNDFDIDGSITEVDLDWKKAGIQKLVTTSQGQFSLASDGNLTFTPAKDFTGEATLEYQITDNGGETDIGNINITIPKSTTGNTNQPPDANNDATYTFLDQPVNLNILDNDFDVDGNITGIDLDLKKAGIQRVFTNSQGRFSVTQNGELTFTPVKGFIGDANINYQIFDNNGATDTANINILVVEESTIPPNNQPPIAIDDSTSTIENQSVNLNILTNDSDADGSITGIDLDTQKTGIQTVATTNQGVFKVSADGDLTFTPASGFTGVATLPYQIFDNSGLSDTANISITVEAETIVTPPTDNTDNTVTNKPPVANYDSTSTTQNKPVTLNISTNDSDSDGNITAVDLNPDEDGIQKQITTAQGSFSLDNNGNLTFVPVSSFTGVATLTYQVTDNDGAQDTAIINIRVNEANKPLDPIECDCVEPILVDNTAQPIDIFNQVTATDIISAGNNDNIIGTEASENILTDGGDDIIDGQGGNDNIIAGKGNDVILGEDGNDYILGERNNDQILAGKDNDFVRGGKDDDLIGGEFGNDTLLGDKGNDRMIGGRIDEEDTIGQDWLYGGIGNDELYGQGGDDYLNGDQDNDSLLGGDGNDLLNGGDGNDLLYGERGNDKMIGGNGEDTIYAGKENDIALGNEGNDLIFGGEGSDTIGGGAGNDTLHGRNGNFSNTELEGEEDYLSGGEGNDWILGEEKADKLCGDTGNDTLQGGKDNDTLCGGDGDDWLKGELGDDTIISGLGNDLIFLENEGKDVIADLQIGIDYLVLPQGASFNQLTFTQSVNGTLINYDGKEIALLSNIAPTDITADLFKSPII